MITLINGGDTFLTITRPMIVFAYFFVYAFVIALFVLFSVALVKLARNGGYKGSAIVGYIPFARWYLLKYALGKINLFGKMTDKVWIYLIIFLFIDVIGSALLSLFSAMNLGIANLYVKDSVLSNTVNSMTRLDFLVMFFHGGNYNFIYDSANNVFIAESYATHYSEGFRTAITVLNVISILISFITIAFKARVYYALFAKYNLRRAIWYVILAIILEISGVSIFASIYFFVVRNKKQFTVEDFLRQNGYYVVNPDNGNINEMTDNEKAEEPFSDFNNNDNGDNGSPFDN